MSTVIINGQFCVAKQVRLCMQCIELYVHIASYDIVAILSECLSSSVHSAPVQRAVLELCAQHANHDADLAQSLFLVAANIAERDCNNSGEATLDDMMQAVAVQSILRERR
jgi:hypothetical protein